MRILRLLRDGRRNRQIADSLAISESTVKSHISAILYKLGLDSRTQAALVAQRLLTGSDAAG
jgi:DNA-binding NarL/FixJ family response regulator